ncbi:MAG TPA: hypothetical protein VL793_15675 [Patescibacteria group bacterium]|nr:hypothetical protein [Patescibacteria group bacterium]
MDYVFSPWVSINGDQPLVINRPLNLYNVLRHLLVRQDSAKGCGASVYELNDMKAERHFRPCLRHLLKVQIPGQNLVSLSASWI